MPYIIKNGLTYTGNLMPITQAQYEALSEAEKNNGIAYFIVDSDAVLDASDVGLGEGNVEDLAGSVAVIETSPATAIHSVGDFILWNGQLYTVTSAIAVGETLTVGSNITATSAGSEISALKAGLTNLSYTSQGLNVITGTGTLVGGGYCKIGNLVIVNFRFNSTTTSTPVAITGFPKPKAGVSANYIGGACYDSENERAGFFYMNANGQLTFPARLGSGQFLVSFTYITE